jgi:hypothetical protein
VKPFAHGLLCFVFALASSSYGVKDMCSSGLHKQAAVSVPPYLVNLSFACAWCITSEARLNSGAAFGAGSTTALAPGTAAVLLPTTAAVRPPAVVLHVCQPGGFVLHVCQPACFPLHAGPTYAASQGDLET